MVEETSLDYANYLRQIDFSKEVIKKRPIIVHIFVIYSYFPCRLVQFVRISMKF